MSDPANSEWMHVSSIGPYEPLEFTPGAPPQSAPKGLDALLFDPIAPDAGELAAWGSETIPDCATYAILDAGVLSLLPELIEASGLEHKCLFKGKALADWGDAAPWLVRLEADNAFTKRLMTNEEGGGFWELQLGIFIRSRQPLEALWKHLRKFTRVEDEKGGWFFNRFWSPPVSTALMQMGNHKDVAPFIAPIFPDGRAAIRIIAISNHGSALMARLPQTKCPIQRPILTIAVQGWLRHIRQVQQFEELILIAQRHVCADMEIDTAKTAAHLRGQREGYFTMGFWRRDHLTMLCVWELMLGPDFINTYENGAIRNILLTAPSDWQAIQRIQDYLDPPYKPSDAEIQAAIIAARSAPKPPPP